MAQSQLMTLPGSVVTIVDAGEYLASENVESALQEICADASAARNDLDALLAPSLRQIHTLPSFPNKSALMYEGMVVYSFEDKDFAGCTTVGEHEIDALTIETGAVTAAGDITIELNGEAVIVSVALDDTAAQVASKIKAAVEAAVEAETIANWAVSIDGSDILFTKDIVGVCVAPTATDTDTTGVTFSAFARDNEGVDTVWASFLA